MEAMFAALTDPGVWIAFVTLTALELVLGIDNIVFISILVDRLPEREREKARRMGLALAVFMRVGLLMALSWLVGLTEPLITVIGTHLSGRDLILTLGGIFLVWKSTKEIHHLTEGDDDHSASAVKAAFTAVILQIIIIDLVFSLDSIITAVGMVDNLYVMVSAVIVSVGLMMLFARAIGADRRRLRSQGAEGLYLLRHGLLHRGGNAQHPHAEKETAARGKRGPMIFRLVIVLWILGFAVLALSATSSFLFSSESAPSRQQRWHSRLRMSLIWPIALLSSAGRARLRRG
jgi:predicted tellurium resistance membrane protein TerC